MGPAHPLVRGHLTQGVYHLSDLGRRGGPRVVGSRRPERSILPPPGNAGSGCQGNRRLAPAVPPTHLPFVLPVASWLRISLSAPQDVQKRGRRANLNSFPTPLLRPSRRSKSRRGRPGWEGILCPPCGSAVDSPQRPGPAGARGRGRGRDAPPRQAGLRGPLRPTPPSLSPWMWPRCSRVAGLGACLAASTEQLIV